MQYNKIMKKLSKPISTPKATPVKAASKLSPKPVNKPAAKPIQKKTVKTSPKPKAKSTPKPATNKQTADDLREDLLFMKDLNPEYFKVAMGTSQENIVALINRKRRHFQSTTEENLPNYGVGKEPPPPETPPPFTQPDTEENR